MRRNIVQLLWGLCLLTTATTQGHSDSSTCLFRSADASLKACIKYLNFYAESNLHKCESKPCSSGSSCPSSCAEVYEQGNRTNGIYQICLKSWFNRRPFNVYCDMETKGGGWTVIQRRGNYGEPSDSFYRNWTDYKLGFGNLSTQFWLGNEYLFALTNQDHMSLRVELEDFDNDKRWAEYEDFRVDDEESSYRMSHLGNYSGNAGDSLSFHKGMGFYTRDRDNWMHCARDRRGGWWYYNCHRANLNGLYTGQGNQGKQFSGSATGRIVTWGSFRGYDYNLKQTEMKIRPSYFKHDWASQ